MSDIETLSDLRAELGECTRCPLSGSRTNIVFGAGSGSARLVFVGEAPGRAEDSRGLPFVGPAGRLLDGLLGDIGLGRGEVYITNVVKCRPPGNRDPLSDEISTCNPFLRSQIALIRPKIVCALGRIAAGVLLERNVQISRMHGGKFKAPGYFVVPVYHPAAALRTPSTMSYLQDDFKRLREYLEDEEPPPQPQDDQPEQMGLF